MCKKCPYSELFSSVFSRIRTEYGDILCISPYSVQMREDTDQSNSKYGLFLRSVKWKNSTIITFDQTGLLLSLTHILNAVAVVSRNPSNSLVYFCIYFYENDKRKKIVVNVFPYRDSNKVIK